MPPIVDLVIIIRTLPQSSSGIDKSKPALVQRSLEAERQYTRLAKELKGEGLKVTARSGDDVGDILVFVGCTDELLKKYFMDKPKSAERIQLVFSIVNSLGIKPRSIEWDMVDSMMCLHDTDFNTKWIHEWTTTSSLGRIPRSFGHWPITHQFGPHVGLYFSFLRRYTLSLSVPSVLGLIAYFTPTAYDPWYSIALILWGMIFVEVWRAHEYRLGRHFPTQPAADQTRGLPWWKQDLRRLTTIPLILFSATVLVALLTFIFVFEAFATKLYTGPGHQLVGFSPTLLFVALVPKFMAVYQVLAKRMTQWELGKDDGDDYEEERTKKVFSMSALVAYLGLALSAFVYVPFGDGVMHLVHSYVLPFLHTEGGEQQDMFAATSTAVKLDAKRLEGQMFAYTVTNQISNTFIEVGLPFVLRAFTAWRNGKKDKHADGTASPKKRVVFASDRPVAEDERERDFLKQVRQEAALPDYDLFVDYSEMVTQFGYVVVWSAAWPLAGCMAMVNNIVEQRGDAFKIVSHTRRPLPPASLVMTRGGMAGHRAKTEKPPITMGPWLDALQALTWIGAVVNAMLVYMFHPWNGNDSVAMPGETFNATKDTGMPDYTNTIMTMKMALLVGLVASHVYLVARSIIRHWVWRLIEVDAMPAYGKVTRVKNLGVEENETPDEKEAVERGLMKRDMGDWNSESEQWMSFWSYDEGVSEIKRVVKEA